jgi:hypothetical protein
VQGFYSAVNTRWSRQIHKSYMAIMYGIIPSEVQYNVIIETKAVNKRNE